MGDLDLREELKKPRDKQSSGISEGALHDGLNLLSSQPAEAREAMATAAVISCEPAWKIMRHFHTRLKRDQEPRNI